jgi:hypothetical protein
MIHTPPQGCPLLYVHVVWCLHLCSTYGARLSCALRSFQPVCVCMYVCMYVCIYIYIYIYIYKPLCIYVYTHACSMVPPSLFYIRGTPQPCTALFLTSVHVCMYACMHVRTTTHHKYARAYTHTHTHTHTYILTIARSAYTPY